MEKKEIDLINWPRKDHYEFFSQFEEPFFGVTVNTDCTLAYKNAKEKGASFFLYYLILITSQFICLKNPI